MLVTKYSDFGVNAHACTNCLNSTSSGSDKVDDAVSAAATAEAEGDEHQDAGDANSKEKVLTPKFPVVPAHSATAFALAND